MTIFGKQMILTATNLSKSYGDKKVLQDVSFSLKGERVYVLMGTNGSGKTRNIKLVYH